MALRVNALLSVNYSHRLNTWSVYIRRIKSESKQEAGKTLLIVGLPLIKEWLQTTRPETWYNGNRTIAIGLIKDSSKYALIETQELSKYQLVNSYIAEIPQ